MPLFAIALALAQATGDVAAAGFCTDRPGLATGTCLVPAGVTQFEASLLSWARSDDADEIAVASTVVRWGIGPRSDLQVGWTPWVRAGGTHSVGDATLAIKHVFTPAGRTVTAAVMPVAKLPLARAPVGNRKLEGRLLLPVDVDLGRAWSLTFTPEMGLAANADRGGHHATLGVAGGPNFALGESWTLSANASVQRDFDPSGKSTETVASLALAWLAKPNLQLDLEVGRGLSRAAPELQVAIGFSVRP